MKVSHKAGRRAGQGRASSRPGAAAPAPAAGRGLPAPL